MFAQMSFEEFLHRLASGKPTPGGGSAAALAGAMGAALLAMFCNLTAGKKKYLDVKDEMEAVAAFAVEQQQKLLELADRDSEAYEKVLAAYRLPKETEAEIDLRQQAINAATLEATRTPLETAKVSVGLLERVPSLAAKGNPNALSDLKVGLALLDAAFSGGKANVEINLPWLEAEDAAAIKSQLAALCQRAEKALSAGRAEIALLE
ncbi:MAG: cyclodeaminase/cyclohydrolase family protein [Bacillota bacterium]|nr:cyclodeaminase/cyclohydrolase family protein [Bacillota bacterium]HOC05740.1 cyclodeaminase/cyclohydrolase family protein [Bacillota bacterium]HPZ21437.1 cyclodeaminase/cyclohydrolase family protein [Bacillota bacterium]HQD19298.1 cyclodeaminase/cyclohydrolase family protein [Bacillota bacterium]